MTSDETPKMMSLPALLVFRITTEEQYYQACTLNGLVCNPAARLFEGAGLYRLIVYESQGEGQEVRRLEKMPQEDVQTFHDRLQEFASFLEDHP